MGLACDRTGTVNGTGNFLCSFIWSLVKLTLQPQLSAAGLFLLERVGQVGDRSGIFSVRGRLELSKDHEARGGREGEVTRWRRQVRAMGHSHPAPQWLTHRRSGHLCRHKTGFQTFVPSLKSLP